MKLLIAGTFSLAASLCSLTANAQQLLTPPASCAVPDLVSYLEQNNLETLTYGKVLAASTIPADGDLAIGYVLKSQNQAISVLTKCAYPPDNPEFTFREPYKITAETLYEDVIHEEQYLFNKPLLDVFFGPPPQGLNVKTQLSIVAHNIEQSHNTLLLWALAQQEIGY